MTNQLPIQADISTPEYELYNKEALIKWAKEIATPYEKEVISATTKNENLKQQRELNKIAKEFEDDRKRISRHLDTTRANFDQDMKKVLEPIVAVQNRYKSELKEITDGEKKLRQKVIDDHVEKLEKQNQVRIEQDKSWANKNNFNVDMSLKTEVIEKIEFRLVKAIQKNSERKTRTIVLKLTGEEFKALTEEFDDNYIAYSVAEEAENEQEFDLPDGLPI